ncbi:MAG: sugar lactone lactonase YvrE [Halocynthiibacter sp.]|jgi:sugar lactone lactonase YvrE
MKAEIFDQTICELGEGPMWHPLRNQLFWFDIVGKRLYTRLGDTTRHWQFEEHVSAAGWIDADRLLIASETALFSFDLESGTRVHLCDLEADNPITRSNDGRADPQGGFWIGTMGKKAEADAGAIYRYYRGELRQLFAPIQISNSICFSPDGKHAYFTDTPVDKIMRVALDGDGWPVGAPEVFLDCKDQPGHPDGSVVDAEGNLWNAQWGAARVACFSPEGAFLRAVDVGGAHSSCPAFGGEDGTTLFVTTALQGMSKENAARYPDNGKVFAAPNVAKGQKEHQVIL